VTDADDAIVDDLDWLGVPSPELRWLAARDYLDEWQQSANDAVDEYLGEMRRQIRTLLLVADFYDFAEQNAHRRGEPIARCVGEDPCTCAEVFQVPERLRLGACSRAWGPRLIAADYLTARHNVLQPYKGKARERGASILDSEMPAYLREGAK
jgi:hypothetical protein